MNNGRPPDLTVERTLNGIGRGRNWVEEGTANDREENKRAQEPNHPDDDVICLDDEPLDQEDTMESITIDDETPSPTNGTPINTYCLKNPREYMRDGCINVFIERLCRDFDNFAALDSSLWQSYKKNGIHHIQQLLTNTLTNFFPICEDKHWVLLVINPETVHYADSIGEPWGLVERFILELKKTRKYEKLTVPRQSDKFNCGVHVCLNAEWFARGRGRKHEEKDVAEFRKKFLDTLRKEKYNLFYEVPAENSVDASTTQRKASNGNHVGDGPVPKFAPMVTSSTTAATFSTTPSSVSKSPNKESWTKKQLEMIAKQPTINEKGNLQSPPSSQKQLEEDDPCVNSMNGKLSSKTSRTGNYSTKTARQDSRESDGRRRQGREDFWMRRGTESSQNDSKSSTYHQHQGHRFYHDDGGVEKGRSSNGGDRKFHQERTHSSDNRSRYNNQDSNSNKTHYHQIHRFRHDDGGVERGRSSNGGDRRFYQERTHSSNNRRYNNQESRSSRAYQCERPQSKTEASFDSKNAPNQMSRGRQIKKKKKKTGNNSNMPSLFHELCKWKLEEKKREQRKIEEREAREQQDMEERKRMQEKLRERETAKKVVEEEKRKRKEFQRMHFEDYVRASLFSMFANSGSVYHMNKDIWWNEARMMTNFENVSNQLLDNIEMWHKCIGSAEEKKVKEHVFKKIKQMFDHMITFVVTVVGRSAHFAPLKHIMVLKRDHRASKQKIYELAEKRNIEKEFVKYVNDQFNERCGFWDEDRPEPIPDNQDLTKPALSWMGGDKEYCRATLFSCFKRGTPVIVNDTGEWERATNPRMCYDFTKHLLEKMQNYKQYRDKVVQKF